MIYESRKAYMTNAFNLARGYRTIRHLTPSQVLHRAICRGQFAAMAQWPESTRALIVRAMRQVPSPDPASPRLAAVTPHIIQLQRAVHGRFLAGISQGRFTLLNREIDFGSLERIDWRRDLGEKNNRLWRMTLAYMGYLVPLFEIDPFSALTVAHSLLASMQEQNPWSSSGVFRDVWHPYAASHRVINLLSCLQLAHRAGVPIKGDAWDLIIKEIRFGAAFVLRNLECDLQYNHLLKNLVCLATVACAGEKGSCYATRELQMVQESVRQQFLADGGQAERSPMYHLLSLMDLRILRDCGVLNPEAQATVRQAAHASAAAANALVHPDGDLALFNDSWAGEAPSALDMISGLHLHPKEPLRIELPQMGYVRLAQGRDNVLMDFGACGPDDNPGHAHADFLSIELSVSGQRAIVDTGVPTYSEGELRNWSRSAQQHNGPAFEGVEPIEFWSSFRVGRRGRAFKLPLQLTEERLAFAAWQSGYLHIGAISARAIHLIPGRGLLIADAWAGAEQHRAASNFVLPATWSRTDHLGFSHVASEERCSLEISALEGAVNADESVPYCHAFGASRIGTRVTLLPSTAQGLRVAGLWIFWGNPEKYREAWIPEAWARLRCGLLYALKSLPSYQDSVQNQNTN